MTNRQTVQIFADVLALASEDRNGKPVTELCRKANLSHGRLQRFLENLTGSGLINKIEYDGKHTFVITPKGKTYLEEYRRFSDYAESFGLEM